MSVSSRPLRKRKKRPDPKRYFLIGADPIEAPNQAEWQSWFDRSEKERTVAVHQFKDMTISTFFWGIDDLVNLQPGPPKLYRTVIKGGAANGMFRGYATEKDALAGHEMMFKMVKKYFSDDKKPDA